MQFAGRVIVEKTLAALDAGFCENRPFCGIVLNDRSNRSLGGVFLDLLLELRILLGLLRQEPIHITKIGFISVGVGKTTGVNIAGGVPARGFVALMIPDISLERHEEAAGDVAGIINNIGHHPLYILFDSGVHLAQPRTCDSGIPQGVTVRAGGALVGVAVEERSGSIAIGISEIHAVKLLACRRGRAVGILLAGGGQAGRPEVGVCGCFDARSAAGGCQSGSREQRQ